MITILIVDDHPIIRRGLRALLEAEPDFHVVGEAADGLEAVSLAHDLRPNVILLDLMMHGISGIEVVRQLTNSSTMAGIIIFSVLGGQHYVLEALRAGARGYMLKDTPAEELISAIRDVAAGHRLLSPALLDNTIDVFLQLTKGSTLDPLETLTAREREVLYLSARQQTSAEIARQLFVSRRTVEVQRASILRKLGLRNQQELVSYALQKGLLTDEPPF